MTVQSDRSTSATRPGPRPRCVFPLSLAPGRIMSRRRSVHRTAAAGITCTAALVTALAGTALASPSSPAIGAAHPAGAAGAAAAASVAGPAGETPPACPDGSGQTPLYLDTHYSFAERAADLVSRMTLPEKVAPAAARTARRRSRGWACSSTRTGARASTASTPLGADTNSGGATGGVHATSFPTNFASHDVAGTRSWSTRRRPRSPTRRAASWTSRCAGTGQNNLGPVRQRLRRPDVLGADRQHGPRPALGPHRRGVRRGPLSRSARWPARSSTATRARR